MNDNNQSTEGLGSLAILFTGIICYQKWDKIQKILMALVEPALKIGAFLFGLWIFFIFFQYVYRRLMKLYANCKAWIDSVNAIIKKTDSDVVQLRQHISDLNYYSRVARKDINSLLEDVKKIKEQITPKEAATKSEAVTKTTEAVEQIVRQNT